MYWKQSLRRLAAVAVLTVLGGVGLPGGSATAATVLTHFDIEYANTYFVGDITWSNRSVQVDGVLRGQATSCRTVLAATWIPSDIGGTVLDERSTSPVCDAAVTERIPLAADVNGGAAQVRIYLRDAADPNHYLRLAECVRLVCHYYP